MTALVPRDSLCYDGSNVIFVDKEHFVHAAGAQLRVASARTGKTVGFVSSPVPGGCPRGISAYAAAPKAKLIAMARRSNPPAIDVVAWPGAGASLGENGGAPYEAAALCKERMSIAMGGAGLEYGALALSRKGERLAAISAVADSVLTVWDLPPPPDPDAPPNYAGGAQKDNGEAPVDEAVLRASVALPCACDSVSFNPANPSMLLCNAATTGNQDGVGGGHPGGLFVYKLSSSHGHTTLDLVECDLDALPPPLTPDEQLLAAEEEEAAEGMEGGNDQYSFGGGSVAQNSGGGGGGSLGPGEDDAFHEINVDHGDAGSEDENEENLHKGDVTHLHGLRSVGAAIWGPGDTIYCGTGAGVVGRFDAATGSLKSAHNKGLGNGTPLRPCVGLVLTKAFVLVASRGRMLYWVKNEAEVGSGGGAVEPFGTVEHSATVFGISNSTPPERVAKVAHSPDFRFLLVGTMEGTLHSQGVDAPKDEEKRSANTGIPDIIPILNDYHEGFVLCSAATQISVPASSVSQVDPAPGPSNAALAMFGLKKKRSLEPAPAPALASSSATVPAGVFATGGTDGSVRLWWVSDGAPACSRTYRSLKPSSKAKDEDDEDESDYGGDDNDEEPGSGQSRRSSSRFQDENSPRTPAALGVQQELDFGLEGGDMVAVEETGSDGDGDEDEDDENKEEDDDGSELKDEEDPLTLPVVAVTCLASMPGSPVVAAGLADGQLSILLVHVEVRSESSEGNNGSAGGSFSMGSDSVTEDSVRKSVAAKRNSTHPSGLSVSLLPLDLKQLTHKPITHLAFSNAAPPGAAAAAAASALPARGIGRGSVGNVPPAVLLAVGCATEGCVFVVEVVEPSEDAMDLLTPRSASSASSGSNSPSFRGGGGVGLEGKVSVRTAEFKANVFRVVARVQVGSDRASSSIRPVSPTGSLAHAASTETLFEHEGGAGAAGSSAHYHGPKVSSLCWSDPGVLLVATSDGEVRAYDVLANYPFTGHGGNNASNAAAAASSSAEADAASGYDPARIAESPLAPIARVVAPPELQRDLARAHQHAKRHSHHHHHLDLPPLCGLLPVANGLPAGGGTLGAGGLLTVCPALREPGLTALPPQGGKTLAAAATGDPGPHGGPTSVELFLHPAAKAGPTSVTVKGHARGVACCALAPVGLGGAGAPRLCATGGLEGLVVLWKVGPESGGGCVAVAELLVHSSPVVALTFSPCGTTLLSVCLDRGVVLTQVTGLQATPLANTAAAGNAAAKRSGFLRAAMLLQASSKEAAAQAMALHTRAVQLRDDAGYQGYGQGERNESPGGQGSDALREIDACEAAAAALRALDFDGPLPAAGNGTTWAEEAAAGDLAGLGALMRRSQPSEKQQQQQPLEQQQAVFALGELTPELTPTSPGTGGLAPVHSGSEPTTGAGGGKDFSTVYALASKLEKLLDANDVASDLEKLDRGAFVVDTGRRDAAVAANQAAAAQVKASIQETDTVRDLVSGRIRSRCDASMEVKACEVRALVHPTAKVANMPLPRTELAKARALECAKRLRMVELLEIRHSASLKVKAAKDQARADATSSAGANSRARKAKDPKQLKALESAAAAKAALSPEVRELERDDGAWPGRRREVPQEVSWVFNEGPRFAPEVDVVGKMLAARQAAAEKEGGGGGKKKEGAGDEEAGGGDGGDAKGGDDGDEEGAAAAGAESGDAAGGGGEARFKELDPGSILTYLYPPCALNTGAQRRLQMLFLGQLVRDTKQGFNKHFAQLAGIKQDAVDAIEERSARIREVAHSLDEPDQTFKPFKASAEDPASFLDVEESAMQCFPYETEQVKADKSAAASAKAKAEAEARKDNIGERALMDMMHGTLDTKKDGALEAKMEPMPEWMAEMLQAARVVVAQGVAQGQNSPSRSVEEVAVSGMTEEQQTEYGEYQEKLKAFDAAAEEARGLLREEVERLGEEVKECCAGFDAQCCALEELRVHAQVSVATQDLYLLRLGVGLLEGEDLSNAMSHLQHKLSTIASQKADLSEQAAKWHGKVEVAKAALLEAQQEDQWLEKGLRKALAEVASAPINNDAYKVLLACFKVRRSGTHGGAPGQGNDGSGRQSASQRRSSSIGGAGSRRTSAGPKKLLSAAAGMVGARRVSNRNSQGFMGLLKGAQKEEQEQQMALAADPFGDLDKATGAASAADGAGARVESGGSVGKGSGGGSFGEVALAAMAKTSTAAKRQAEASLNRMLAPLDKEVDCPDGFVVENSVWGKLQSQRVAKIKAELELKRLGRALVGLKRGMDFIDSRDEALEHGMGEVEVEVAVLERRRQRSAKNFEVLVKLAQGQVEVLEMAQSAAAGALVGVGSGGGGGGGVDGNHNDSVPPPLAPDMSRGVLLSASKVNALNDEIKAVGAEKIHALGKMKQFRRQINYMQWEDNFMGARLEDLGEFYSDLLLLRVEKSALQAMKSGGGGSSGSGGGGGRKEAATNDKPDLAHLGEKRLAVSARIHAAKVGKLNEACAKLGRSVKERRGENERLREQLRALEHSVAAREAIYRARVDAAGGELSAASAAVSRMKRVTMRRRLVDLARTQTEEMDFLRSELDSLRQRTFPSFAHAARHRLLLPPDEVV